MSFITIPSRTFIMGHKPESVEHLITLTRYQIEDVEVSGDLWDKVYAWAIKHGYKFHGRANSKGPQYPASNMRWVDAVKWCNARSEMEGFVPAYYTTSAMTTPYRRDVGRVLTNLTNDCVSWACRGYRLPTEAEWECTARRGGYMFPWGDTISHARANYFAAPGEIPYDESRQRGYNPVGGKSNPRTTKVGTFMQTDNGLCNIVGNVSEWCWDRRADYPIQAQTNPHGPDKGTTRIVRGGSWDELASRCRVFDRQAKSLTYRSTGVGLRCVRTS